MTMKTGPKGRFLVCISVAKGFLPNSFRGLVCRITSRSERKAFPPEVFLGYNGGELAITRQECECLMWLEETRPEKPHLGEGR